MTAKLHADGTPDYSFELAGVRFESKQHLLDELRRLRKVPREVGSDTKLAGVLAVLAERHPDGTDRFGPKPWSFAVGGSPGGKEGTCYYVVSANRRTPLPAEKLVRGVRDTAKSMLAQAARGAVRADMDLWLRDQFQGRQTVTCALTGASVTFAQATADHVGEPFASWSRRQAAKEPRPPKLIRRDGYWRFADSRVEARFREAHRELIRAGGLQVAEARANSAKGYVPAASNYTEPVDIYAKGRLWTVHPHPADVAAIFAQPA